MYKSVIQKTITPHQCKWHFTYTGNIQFSSVLLWFDQQLEYWRFLKITIHFQFTEIHVNDNQGLI